MVTNKKTPNWGVFLFLYIFCIMPICPTASYSTYESYPSYMSYVFPSSYCIGTAFTTLVASPVFPAASVDLKIIVYEVVVEVLIVQNQILLKFNRCKTELFIFIIFIDNSCRSTIIESYLGLPTYSLARERIYQE